MRFRFIVALAVLIAAGLLFQPAPGRTATIAERTSGYIVLQVEKNGEAWYVYPKTLTRFFLGRPADAFTIMRERGLGITNTNLEKIPRAGSNDGEGDVSLRNRLSGYILIQVERNGEAWYVYPKDKKRYYLGRPDDAFSIMRNLGLGITNNDLAQIPIDGGLVLNQKSVATSRGTYTIDYLTFDRTNSNLKIMTDTGNNGNCSNNCTVLSLASYISRRAGIAGMHGTYFCPADYAACAGQVNFYFFPVFNSFTRVMVNADRIKFTQEPLVAFDTTNRPFWYTHTEEFTSEQDFYNEFAVDSTAAGGSGVLRSAISNGPPLTINSQNVVGQYSLDDKQRNTKSYRGAIGWKGTTIYLMVVRSATVLDSAAVMDALNLDFALNLDGGGSTALYQGGRYIIGPGRNLPNAIVITQ